MAVTTEPFPGNGADKIFTPASRILSQSHVRVDFTYEDVPGEGLVDHLITQDSWDVINNSVVFEEAPTDGYLVTISISTDGEGLDVPPSTATQVSVNIDNINIVAGINSEITTLAGVSTAIASLYADKAALDSLYADKVPLDSLYADKATLDSLFADKATLDSLFADKATLDSLYADKVTLDSIFTDKATLDSLFADKATLDSLLADKATLDSIFADKTSLDAIYSNLTEILQADTNAQTAIDKAQEASDSAAEAALTVVDRVPRTSSTGSAILPSGTTAERDVTPSAGMFRFNSDDESAEIYNGSSWGSVGGSVNDNFYENSQNITKDYTLAPGRNAMIAGDVIVNDGITITISDGSNLVVV